MVSCHGSGVARRDCAHPERNMLMLAPPRAGPRGPAAKRAVLRAALSAACGRSTAPRAQRARARGGHTPDTTVDTTGTAARGRESGSSLVESDSRLSRLGDSASLSRGLELARRLRSRAPLVSTHTLPTALSLASVAWPARTPGDAIYLLFISQQLRPTPINRQI